MNEWSFITAHADGLLISQDGRLPKNPQTTVRDVCTGGGWDVEHATFDTQLDYWRLILSRPFAQARPTTSNLDDAVMIGAA